MAKKNSYHDYLRQEMTEMVDALELPELCKQSLKSRWLDQVIWADKKAEQCRQWHYRLRLTAIVGGVLLPAIVGINFELGKDNVFLRTWFPYLPFALSQVIAVSVAAEEFLRFGDRWRQYRQLAEDLKAEGWEYLQLSGPYSSGGVDLEDSPPPLPRHRMSEAKLEDWKAIKRKRRKNPRITHKDVYTLFAGRVESLINDDVQSYISALQQQQAKESEQIQQILEKAEEVSTNKSLFAKPEPPPPQLPPSQPANRSNNGYGAMGTPQPTPFNSPPPSNHPMMGQPSGYAAPPANPAMGQPTAYAAPPTPMAQPSGYAAPSTNPAMGQPTAYAAPPTHPTMGQPTAYAAPPTHPTMGQPTAYAAPPTPMAQPSGYAAPSTNPAMGQPTAYASPPTHPTMGQPTAYAAPSTPMAQPMGYAAPSANPAMGYANPLIAQPTAVADLNARILASANKLRNMSTADGPDGGNNACAWTVNKVLQDAGIHPIGDNPNYVPAVLQALQQGRGQQVPRESSKAGDLVVAFGEAHIGIGLTDGCSRVLSNSSSQACFAWESDTDFDGYYRGPSIIYRLLQ